MTDPSIYKLPVSLYYNLAGGGPVTNRMEINHMLLIKEQEQEKSI